MDKCRLSLPSVNHVILNGLFILGLVFGVFSFINLMKQSVYLIGIGSSFLFIIALFLSALFRKKVFLSLGFTIISIICFVLAVDFGEIIITVNPAMTYSTICAIALIHFKPMFVILTGLAMTSLYLLSEVGNPIYLHNNIVGSSIITIIIALVLYMNKQIAKERDKYKWASITDNLTKVYTFTHVHEIGSTMLQKGKNLRVLLMDINNFKPINDTYGHLVGNLVLINISDVLRKKAENAGGIVGRLGGDEFLIVGEDNEKMENLKQSLNQYFASNELPLGNGMSLSVQLSIGEVCTDKGEFSNFEQILHEADMDMYRIKQQNPM